MCKTLEVGWNKVKYIVRHIVRISLSIMVLTGMTVSLTGCSHNTDEEQIEIVVFAASSMTETLNEIGEMYQDVCPDVTVLFNYDSSGTLQSQIESGAYFDLFISAAQDNMDQLDGTVGEEKNPKNQDYIDASTRINLLKNVVTLVVSESNALNITSIEDMAQLLEERSILLAIGNSDVPVGQYSLEILSYYGIDENAVAAVGCISYGSNVKEVTTQVSESSVDCGLIYQTDAYSAGLAVVDWATEEMCGQVIYPVAIGKNSKQREATQEFLDYLMTEECMSVFETVGFQSVE